jgi:methenyltetrahydromethanopterin cyclohydrolase
MRQCGLQLEGTHELHTNSTAGDVATLTTVKATCSFETTAAINTASDKPSIGTWASINTNIQSS